MTTRPLATNHAFERLYRDHVMDVYRYALAVIGNASDAEDITQTTFMNAYRALERGEHPRKPRYWLVTIAHNLCRQRFRQAARRPTQVAYEEDLAEALAPSEDTPSAADIQRALGQLAFNQREALVMRELEGRSYAEIGELLGLSTAAVETLLFRARRALREQLEGSLSCSEAEAALSLQLDGQLSRRDAAQLRSHLRACSTCRTLARRQRAQRKSLHQALAVIAVPPGLTSWFGGTAVGPSAAGLAATGLATAGTGATGIGAALATKVAVATVAALAVGAGGYTVAQRETATHHPPPSLAAARNSKPGAAVRPGTAAPATPGHTSAAEATVMKGGHRSGRAHAARSTPAPAGTHGRAQTHAGAQTSAIPAVRGPRPVAKSKPSARPRMIVPMTKKPAHGLGTHGRRAGVPSHRRSCSQGNGPSTASTPAAPTTTALTSPPDASCPEPQVRGRPAKRP